MDKQQAFYSLWSSFGVPAYDENRVPEEATYPRITYQVIVDCLDEPVFPTATLWARGTSWTWLDAKLKEISDHVEDMLPLQINEGYIQVSKGTPWAQRVTDPSDRMIIGYRLNLGIEFLTKY